MTTPDSIIIEFDIANRSYAAISLDEFSIDPNNPNKIYWIHSYLKHKDAFKQIATKLKLPESVIALCKKKDSMPHLIDNDVTLTLQVQCLLSSDYVEKREENHSHLIIHLTNQFCFTASSVPIPAVLEFLENYPKAINYAKTPCFILFLILDNTVNDYARGLFTLELEADEMDLIIHQTRANIYEKVTAIKKQAMKTKRYIAAIQEILMRVSGRKITVISEACRVSLFNLFNHCQMVDNEADSIREILNGLLDQIDNSLMQRMNETMRVLTAFAAIFLPLTLITGIYGMNFHWMPELTWKYGYFYALGLIFFIGIALYIAFKRRKWF